MRVRFFAPHSETESERYLRVIADVDEFWARFRRCAQTPLGEWVSMLRQQLARLDSELGLEVRNEPDGMCTMYIVPVGGARRLPLAELCVERAPQMVPWTFGTARPGVPFSKAVAMVQRRFGFDFMLARARVGVERGHLLSVVLGSPEFTGTEDERACEAAEDFLATLLGDECFDAWIGSVSVQAAPRPSILRVVGSGAPALPLHVEEAQQAIDRARAAIVEQCPDRPLHRFCEHMEWTLLELEDTLSIRDSVFEGRVFEGRALEAGALAYRGLRTSSGLAANDGSLGAPSNSAPLGVSTPLGISTPQCDLLMAATAVPEALKCFLSQQPFSSLRFSRHRERFCYLKLRLTVDDDEARVRIRTEVEDALDKAMVPGGLGCVVGSGLGREYVYVNLALSQVDPAVSLIGNRVERHTAVRDAWLFFCDDEWSDEWVALGRTRRAPPSR